MFNILDFIDSKDIREYNQNTSFTPIEQAVIIYNSKKTTVEEKLSAWKELLANHSEEDFKYNQFGERQFADDKSNKQIIEETVAAFENSLAMQNATENVVFEAVLWESDYPDSLDPRYFKDYFAAFIYLQECKKEYTSDSELANVMTRAKIRVKEFNTEACDDTVFYFDNEMRMIELIPGSSTLVSDSYDIANIFVHVPLPFRKGDILRSIKPGKTDYGLITYDPNEDIRPWTIDYGDSTDMWFRLDSYDSDDGFIYGHLSPWDYEFCPFPELPEELSILFVLRYVYLGKMEFCDFLNLYSVFGKDIYPKIYRNKYPGAKLEE